MRIRVDLPINKPLRRGANIVNLDGDKYWFTFKYERLPNFCFLCGILGHDEKRCSGIQVILKLSDNMGIGYEQMAIPKVDLKNPERLVAMASRNGKMKVQMISKPQRPPTR